MTGVFEIGFVWFLIRLRARSGSQSTLRANLKLGTLWSEPSDSYAQTVCFYVWNEENERSDEENVSSAHENPIPNCVLHMYLLICYIHLVVIYREPRTYREPGAKKTATGI